MQKCRNFQNFRIKGGWKYDILRICEKYNLSMYTVRRTIGCIYPGMSLIKRRMSNELKAFYELNMGDSRLHIHQAAIRFLVTVSIK